MALRNQAPFRRSSFASRCREEDGAILESTLRDGRYAGTLAVSATRSPMNRLERFYKIDQLLQERTVVPRDAFLHELEISLATFKRDLEYMRDRFNSPVIWDGAAGGYRYEKRAK